MTMPQNHQATTSARRQSLIVGCLAGGCLALAPAAWAQPEVDGNPDSSAFVRISSDTDDWTRHFRIGALVGININANFSEKGTFNLSGNNAANGIYNDGYVLPDKNGDPAFTSNWGYDNRSQQYNAGSQTLQMHSTTGYATSSAGNSDGGGAFAGFEMAYGDNLWYWKHARVGWELGFGLLPINISESSIATATVSQNTYTFSTATMGPEFPTAQSYQGGSSGTGYILPTAYTASNSITSGSISGSHTLDVMLYTVRFGPAFYWDLTGHVGMSMGAGAAVGLVSGECRYNEIITAGGVSARNSGSFSGTDVVFGGNANATLLYHTTDNGRAVDLFISAQYAPMTDATLSGGGREGRLNLDGQLYFSVGINWPF